MATPERSEPGRASGRALAALSICLALAFVLGVAGCGGGAEGVVRTRIEGAWSVADVEAAARDLLGAEGK